MRAVLVNGVTSLHKTLNTQLIRIAMRRRPVLLVVGGLLTAGCSGLSGSSPPPTADTTATETADTTPAGTLQQLTFDATVISQSAQASPATIATTLTNTGEIPVEVGTGPTLVFRVDGDALKHSILLYPETFIGPNETPTESTDSCWRYTDDRFLVQDSLEYHTVAPGEAIEESHRVYTVGEDSPCLPAGKYLFSDEVIGADESSTMVLEIALTIAGDGQVAVTADEAIE